MILLHFATSPIQGVFDDREVTVVNKEAVEEFSYGDKCFLRPRGEVGRFSVPRQVVLMEYRAPKDGKADDLSCPSGTIFVADPKWKY